MYIILRGGTQQVKAVVEEGRFCTQANTVFVAFFSFVFGCYFFVRQHLAITTRKL